MKTRQVIKIVTLVIGGFLITIGVYFLISSWCFFSQLKQWSKTNEFDIKVDLSQPGEYSKKFDLKCPYAALHDLLLVLPHSLSEESDEDGLFSGLDANLSVMDYSGAEIAGYQEMRVYPRTELHDGRVLLIPFGGLSQNTYTFKLTVSKGAKALSGVEQRLVLNNIIGMAFMGPILYLVLGAPSFIVGVFLVLLMIRLLKQKSYSHKESQPVTAQNRTE